MLQEHRNGARYLICTVKLDEENQEKIKKIYRMPGLAQENGFGSA
jgi:hypothetical protein